MGHFTDVRRRGHLRRDEPEALIVTTVTTVTFAWSVIVVMVVTITRIVMVAGREVSPKRKGSFLAINHAGGDSAALRYR